MRLSDFDFHLPRGAIAQRPVTPRDAARMLHLPVQGAPQDLGVRDLPRLLRPGDVAVFNDTRVIPARLRGKRGTASVEVTLHKRETAERWRAFARPARKLQHGNRIDFAEDFSAEVVERGEGGDVLLQFDRGGAALMEALDRHGELPLPPYIQRAGGADTLDQETYQTVYARIAGAVAAPTAGLHFTPELLEALDERGVQRVNATLHVGAGTFLPVKDEDVSQHRMHAEWGSLSAEAAAKIEAAKTAGGRVVAIGTTALRLLETAADDSGHIGAFEGETDIFILPGYRFKLVDLLMTNFHLPKSTLFMLVCAFAGQERMRAAYEHAVSQGYRFFSFGDASLLERHA
ncbi:tRNA preQ1(34) S-adenosylmethionine ribosyltransferase-isomerase QueA [Aquibaculum sediminis]|uniref:tRNA preQ1(34) S-adenosylmethionine ribosyltransferase-isomerase QueA n=1 Tax=Aquibaculum sediminis TaxID=3231907 RepID=UPI0034563010